MGRIHLTAPVLLAASATAVSVLTGCGVSPSSSCTTTEAVAPATASADHMAAAPGDQTSFNVNFSYSGGCAVPLVIAGPSRYQWVSSDPINAPISNAATSAGVATCVGATTAKISTNPVGSIAVATLTCH
jgi:hypothetical protein